MVSFYARRGWAEKKGDRRRLGIPRTGEAGLEASPAARQRAKHSRATASGVGRSLGAGDLLKSLPNALAGLQAVMDGVEDETADGALLRAGGIADVLRFLF